MNKDFDGGVPASSEPARTIYTVAQLVQEVRTNLEEAFEDVWVEGEISNYRVPGSGHSYFTLKDEKAQVAAVLFRFYAQHLRFKPEDGLKVIVHGKVTVYEPRGDLQVSVRYMEPKGLGSLQLAFEQLKAKLHAEGLFDESLKKPIPMLARRIGIVTSPTGAALRDILRILRRRHFNVQVLIAPVRVQGSDAAPGIAEAIAALDTRFDLDVIIVTRGGGSIEDLWPFNEEVVARAIAVCNTPVISAVGHEIDFTISDFVADLRAPTPSAAAEMVIARKDELASGIASLQKRLSLLMSESLKGRRIAFERLSSSRVFTDAMTLVERYQQRIDEIAIRMGGAVAGALTKAKTKLEIVRRCLQVPRLSMRIQELRGNLAALERTSHEAVYRNLMERKKSFAESAGKLQSLSPLAVLLRGYGICRRKPDGRIITSAMAVNVGDEVSIQLSEGGLACGVLSRLEPKP